jgi:hypothetical protein
MTKNPLGTDHLMSWARRDDDRVEVQAVLARAGLDQGPVVVELSHDGRVLQATGEVSSGGRVVSFSVEGSELGRSAWQIAVRAGAEETVGLRARLLAAPGQPVALLSGSPPDTRMPPPKPRPPVTRARRLARRLPPGARRALARARELARSTRSHRHR